MSTTFSLYDFEITEFPNIAKRLLLGEIKLTALIVASDPGIVGRDRTTYFLPDDGFVNQDNFATILTTPNLAKAYEVESGRYEILNTESIAEKLDRIYHAEKVLGKVMGPANCQNKIQISHTISPKGVEGDLMDLIWIKKDKPGFAPPHVSYNRILLEEILAPFSSRQYAINTPEFAAVIDVFEEFWSSGKDGEKKDQIVDWIMKKYKFSKKTAEVIDTICRPELRRKGGLSKLNVLAQ